MPLAKIHVLISHYDDQRTRSYEEKKITLPSRGFEIKGA